MTGARITDRQVRRYMDERRRGHTQATAAAKAGFSERTGRRLDANPVLPSQRSRERTWRTREDPFAGVWDDELVPILRSVPHIRATTLLGNSNVVTPAPIRTACCAHSNAGSRCGGRRKGRNRS